MDQPQNSNQPLTPAEQNRKDIWAGALNRAGIPADSMDWKQPEVAAPLYAKADGE